MRPLIASAIAAMALAGPVAAQDVYVVGIRTAGMPPPEVRAEIRRAADFACWKANLDEPLRFYTEPACRREAAREAIDRYEAGRE